VPLPLKVRHMMKNLRPGRRQGNMHKGNPNRGKVPETENLAKSDNLHKTGARHVEKLQTCEGVATGL